MSYISVPLSILPSHLLHNQNLFLSWGHSTPQNSSHDKNLLHGPTTCVTKAFVKQQCHICCVAKQTQTNFSSLSLPQAIAHQVHYNLHVQTNFSITAFSPLFKLPTLLLSFMIKSCTCMCKGRQNKVRHSLKADSEKNTELPRTGFEPVTTGLLVQCSAN